SRHRRSARRSGRDGDVEACQRARHAARALDSRTRIGAMNCSEAEVLIHALIDGELDAGHARELEAHAATCPDCARNLAAFRELRQTMAAADLKEKAPASLRTRIEAALPLPPTPARAGDAAVVPAPVLAARRFNRRFFVGGVSVSAARPPAGASTPLLRGL